MGRNQYGHKGKRKRENRRTDCKAPKKGVKHEAKEGREKDNRRGDQGKGEEEKGREPTDGKSESEKGKDKNILNLDEAVLEERAGVASYFASNTTHASEKTIHTTCKTTPYPSARRTWTKNRR